LVALQKKGALAPTTNTPESNKTQNPVASIIKNKTLRVLDYLFILMALSGSIPVITFFVQYNLVGLHAFINHFHKCKNYMPRISVVIPAWNEEFVLEHTISLLLKIDYPLSALRIYVVDDGSTDDTQKILTKMQSESPNNVFNVRKNDGGKGKSHAINYGLNVILADEWAEAIMIIDADIAFKKDALLKMARHLADPEVGAVTAYIKEGTRNPNCITKSIGYEYVTSQFMARRAQNVLGVLACLAGGAQLHSRANIELIGGQINTTTLAEDTYTTFETQKLGNKVIFEGNAFVYAEEPDSIVELWKQRFRWARGNIQITHAFKDVWFRNSKKIRLGSLLFGIIWFCILLMPILMILTAVGLVGLFIIHKKMVADLFCYMASVSFFVYLYTTLFAFIIDRKTSRIAWLEGLAYPGLISLFLMILSVNPFLFNYVLTISPNLADIILLFIITWCGFCMLWAWLIYRLELAGVSQKITHILLLIVGYGPLLCAVNLIAYIAEIIKPNLQWDKTEKRGFRRVVYSQQGTKTIFDFKISLHKDIQREYRIFFQELACLAIIIALFIIL
jgi:cellulose synthase/poly-beta-1,6-N-acetylglucosamine synthase-like glycosyltransferase